MAIIDELLQGMLAEKGSDMHLMVNEAPRIRVSGDLSLLDMPPLLDVEMEMLLKEICPAERWQNFLQTRDLDFAYEIPGVARFRCNYLHDYRGLAAVFRVIPTRIATMEQLKLPPVLRQICEMRDGLVLVTGPTGSGKSTTLAAMIDFINRNLRRKIITVEDPIEFVHENRKSVLLHREVGQHAPSFASALRSAMRANPDILLIGEMRDLETIRLALQCATMGILVFGTLHTNNAPKTVDRIIDAFPGDEQPQIRMMLAECLAAVVSQLLCRTSDGSGRVAVHEILLRTEALPNAIREGQISSIRTIIESGGEKGMISMDESIFRALEADLLNAETAYRLASEKDRFAAFLGISQEAAEKPAEAASPPPGKSV
ncbi:MAG: PilT/PilU family type 4a pilus ATPase [Lentisphaeria bacterium]|jgi:twitching motility protein PilT|nr:PilT/PilU family type 4a pilus ATPase [Lentisphaeria bacterium]